MIKFSGGGGTLAFDVWSNVNSKQAQTRLQPYRVNTTQLQRPPQNPYCTSQQNLPTQTPIAFWIATHIATTTTIGYPCVTAAFGPDAFPRSHPQSLHTGFQATGSPEEGPSILNASPDWNRHSRPYKHTAGYTRIQRKTVQHETLQLKATERIDSVIS